MISLAEQYQSHSGGYVLQSRSNTARALVTSRRSDRSRGGDGITVARLLSILDRLLPVGARRQLVCSARERERAGRREGFGLGRVGRMSLDSLHGCDEQIRKWIQLSQKRCQADLRIKN